MSDEIEGSSGDGVIQKFLLGLVTLCIAALVGLVINLDRRVGTIEANRFTDRDANALERRIVEGSPPRWLIDRLDAMEGRIDTRLQGLEDAVNALRSSGVR